MTLLAGTLVFLWAAALSAVDVRDHRLPNVLTLPGAVAIVAGSAFAGRFGPAVLGAAALALAYLAVHLAAPASMGGGDVKLALGLGALTAALSVEVWVLGALGAPLITAVAGAVNVARGRGGAVAHGPSMCAASLAAAAAAAL